MSGGTERVTLSAEEREALIRRPRELNVGLDDTALERTVERILAAREQALREEIAGQIEADRRVGVPPDNDYRMGYIDGHEDGRAHAACIARGETQ